MKLGGLPGFGENSRQKHSKTQREALRRFSESTVPLNFERLAEQKLGRKPTPEEVKKFRKFAEEALNESQRLDLLRRWEGGNQPERIRAYENLEKLVSAFLTEESSESRKPKEETSSRNKRRIPQAVETKEEELKAELQAMRRDSGVLQREIAAQRELLEQQREQLEALKKQNKISSGELRQLQMLPRVLEDLGGQQAFMQEVEETQKTIIPEEHTAFGVAFLENIESGFKGKKLKNKQEAYSILISAVRDARAKAKQNSSVGLDIPAKTFALNKDAPELSWEYTNDLAQRAAASALGVGSAVIDAGTISSLIMFGVMASYGSAAATFFKFGGLGHLSLFAACFAVVAPTMKKMERAAFIDPATQDERFLDEERKREWNRPGAKLRRGVKRGTSMAMSLAFSALQLQSIFWVAAATIQGGNTSSRIESGVQNLRRQTENLEVRDFDERLLSSFDSVEDLETTPAFQELSAVEQSIIRLRLRRMLVVDAEYRGVQIEGAGTGVGVGCGPRCVAKEVFGAGRLERSFEIPPTQAAFERGTHDAQAARERVRQRFHAEFPNHPGVFLDSAENPVSVEEQLMVFSADYAQAAQPILADLENRYGDIIQLGEDIRSWVGGEEPETNPDESLEPGEPQPSSDAGREAESIFRKMFGLINVKGAFSIGNKPPSETTLAPDLRALQAEDSPIYQLGEAYNEHFLRPSQRFMQLVQEEYNRLDEAEGAGGGGVTVTVPEARLDPTPLTGIPLQGDPNFYSFDFYREVFADPLRATGAGILVLIFLMLRHGESSISYARFRSRREDLLEDFWLKRNMLEGKGDTREGAEYRFAKYIASNLNLLFSHKLVQGLLKDVHITPEMVISAMREAAAKQPESLTKPSPTKVHQGILGKISSLAEAYTEGLTEIPVGNTPVPPAVAAFNHLVRLYRNPAELTVRIAEELLPGISEVLELAFNPEDTSTAENLASLDRLPKEKAERYARVRLAIDNTKIRHLEFKIRHEETRVEFMRTEAFNRVFVRLTGKEKTKFFTDSIDLRHADFSTLEARYGRPLLNTLRHSALSRLIAAKMGESYAEARARVAEARKQIEAIETEEDLVAAKFGGIVGQRIHEGKRIRRSGKKEDKTFKVPDSLHEEQFSSVEAIERQYLEEIVRAVQKEWKGDFSINEETEVVPQLEAMQRAVNTSCFGSYKVPEGYEEPKVEILPSTKLTPEQKKAWLGPSVAEGGDSEQFTDYHVVTYTFFDAEQKPIFTHGVEIRGLLSENRDPGNIQSVISRYMESRQQYFALRVNLRHVENLLLERRKQNRDAIAAIQTKLITQGFLSQGLVLQGNDFQPIDLFRENALQGIETLSRELGPQLIRKRRWNEILEGNDEAQKHLEEKLRPAFQSKVDNPKDRTLRDRSTENRYESARERIQRISVEDDARTLEERFDSKEFERVATLYKFIQEHKRELRRAGIEFKYGIGGQSYQGRIYVSSKEGILMQKKFEESLSVGDLLDIIERNKHDVIKALRGVTKRREDRIVGIKEHVKRRKAEETMSTKK